MWMVCDSSLAYGQILKQWFYAVQTCLCSWQDWEIKQSLLVFHCLFNYYFLSFAQAVTLHTDVGDIKIELFCERTPKTCEVSQVPGVGVPSGETKQ